jgi:hypothetical protein
LILQEYKDHFLNGRNSNRFQASTNHPGNRQSSVLQMLFLELSGDDDLRRLLEDTQFLLHFDRIPKAIVHEYFYIPMACPRYCRRELLHSFCLEARR